MFKFIEVCAGAGGLSSGFIKSGLVPELLNDVDKNCCKTLEMNHAGVKVICKSMLNLESDLTEYKNIPLLCGGVPCQSYSQSGLRKGLDDPRGDLLLRFLELVEKLEPKMFLIENVKGLITHNKGETFKTIVTKMESRNYTISYKVLNSNDYDVPQKRERIIIVGLNKAFLKTEGYLFQFPSPMEKRLVLKDVLVDVPLSPCAKYSQIKIDLFKQIGQGKCWTALSLEEQKKYLGKSYESGGGKRGILYRLSMEKPSLTLLCSPSQKQTERCHPLDERPLSIREYARIQTFSDDYEFTGSIASQYKQIGNAVPVMMAYHLGIQIKKTFENELN